MPLKSLYPYEFDRVDRRLYHCDDGVMPSQIRLLVCDYVLDAGLLKIP